MTTEAKSITPEQAGLTLAVLSGPRGEVRDDWPCIGYTVEVSNARRQVIWTGPYYLGVGHVKPYPYGTVGTLATKFTPDEENCSHHWARGAVFKKEPKAMQLQASTAAKLAQYQKVAPKLDDVCHSILSDGAAFFDGERFEEWCANYGYDTDSRKAEATWRACDDIGRALARGLSRDELDGLRQWASNY